MAGTGRQRVTYEQIAARAGVSVGTVDRVMNGRGGVSTAKSAAVIAAVEALDYGHQQRPQVWHSLRRIEVMLPRNPSPFWVLMDRTFRTLAEILPRQYRLSRTSYSEGNPRELADMIAKQAGGGGSLIIAADTDGPIPEVLGAVQARGVRVITLTTVIRGVAPFLHSGIDNIAAGRTAAHLLRGLVRRGGPVAVLTPHMRRDEFRQRIAGFRQVIGDDARVEVVQTEGSGSQGLGGALAGRIRAGTLTGIYDCGHDATDLVDPIRASAARPVWIGHEPSPCHRGLLCEGLMDFVLDQDAVAQAAWALRAAIDANDVAALPLLSMAQAPKLQILCRENLPDRI